MAQAIPTYVHVMSPYKSGVLYASLKDGTL